jgi:hypothetical protein
MPRRRTPAEEVARRSQAVRDDVARRDEAIRAMRAEGHAFVEIAQAAGLTHAAVRKIVLSG